MNKEISDLQKAVYTNGKGKIIKNDLQKKSVKIQKLAKYVVVCHCMPSYAVISKNGDSFEFRVSLKFRILENPIFNSIDNVI